LTKGEFVVLIDNAANPADERLNTDDMGMLKVLLDEVSVKIAVKIATHLTGKKKNELYQQALQLRDATELNATD
jgi:16S rRNA (cytidine1402-2'-O)-methyltransferase